MKTIEAANWLRTFYALPYDSDETSGDDLGTTYGICGAVILAAVLTETRSPERLADVTRLPVAFTAVVMANMDYMKLWHSKRFAGLCRTMLSHRDDHENVQNALQCFLEEFWVRSKLPGVEMILPALRGTSLLFGRSQAWIDQELINEPCLNHQALL